MPVSTLTHGQGTVGQDHLKAAGRHHGLIARLMPETHASLVIKPDRGIGGVPAATHLTTSSCQAVDVNRLPRMPFTVPSALGIWKAVPRVGIDEGEQLAAKTYNPRLGVVGGLSVLGTKGIVEPKSLASWLASIELYVRIALADDAKAIVLAPGNIGQLVAERQLGLTPERVVPMANFVGFALNTVDQELGNHHRKLEQLWLVGHPGKLAKILENHWDTHSGVSPMAMQGILELAKVFGMKPSLLEKCKDATTVEAIIQQFGKTPESSQFWQLVEQRITEKVQSRLQHVLEVRTLLFDMHRNPLGLPLIQSCE